MLSLGSLRRLAVVRLVAGLGAVLQLVALPVAAMAEGAGARGAGSVVAHLEAERSGACAPAHADDCALCQLLITPIDGSAGSVSRCGPTPEVACLPESERVSGHAPPSGRPPARAPPGLS